MTPMPEDRSSFSAPGFTLIEVMLVIAIFSIAILATMSLQTGAVNTNSTARKSTLAMEYAVDTMESLMRVGGSSEDRFNMDDDGVNGVDDLAESELNNDGIDNDGDGSVDEADELEWFRLGDFAEGTGYTRGNNIPLDDYCNGAFDLSWDVTNVDCNGDGTDDGKRIDVTVSWEGGNKEVHLSGVRTSVF